MCQFRLDLQPKRRRDQKEELKEELKDEFKDYEEIRQIELTSLKEKSKLRARKTRLRKKDWERNLQEQVDELLKENEALRKQLQQYRIELLLGFSGKSIDTLEETKSKESLSLIRSSDKIMNSENIFAIKSKDSEILESNEETIQANESSTAKALNILKTTLDIAFDVIIENCIQEYDSVKLDCANKRLESDIDKLKRIKKLKRLQLEEYRRNKEFNQFEEILANVDLNKRQLDAIKEYFIPKYSKAKADLKKGIECLIKAKRIIFSTLFELDSVHKFLKSSEVLTNSQLQSMNSLIISAKSKCTSSIFNIFGISKIEKPLTFKYQLKDILSKRKYEASIGKQLMYTYSIHDLEMNDDN